MLARMLPSFPQRGLIANLPTPLAGDPGDSYLLQCVYHGLKVHTLG